jgi:hypothetical protein
MTVLIDLSTIEQIWEIIDNRNIGISDIKRGLKCPVKVLHHNSLPLACLLRL